MKKNNRYEYEDFEMKKFFDQSSFKPQEAKAMCDRLNNFAEGTKYFVKKANNEAQNKKELADIHEMAVKNVNLLYGQHKDLIKLVCDEDHGVSCIMLESCGDEFATEMKNFIIEV